MGIRAGDDSLSLYSPNGDEAERHGLGNEPDGATSDIPCRGRIGLQTTAVSFPWATREVLADATTFSFPREVRRWDAALAEQGGGW